MIDLSLGATAAPEAGLHRALAAAVTELPRHLPGPGYDPLGLPVLPAAVAAHLSRRGVATAPQQVLVTARAQHALTLLLRVLVGPGDRAAARSRSARPEPALSPPGTAPGRPSRARGARCS